MTYVIAQISDIHIGSPHAGAGERLSLAVGAINAMGRRPDLVILTGDLTQDGSPEQWAELDERLGPLEVPHETIRGNHDQRLTEAVGNRAIDCGPLRVILLDTACEAFEEADAAWLHAELASHAEQHTLIAMHHPPFETGIWWMDCIGMSGSDLFEDVVRRHPQVIKVIAGHVHRAIQTNWDGCSLWVSPSTAVSVAVDLDPAHAPAESAEPPAISLHAYTGRTIVSHVVPVGPTAVRSPIDAPAFVAHARELQRARPTEFG